MNSLKALQAWYDYGVLLHAASRMNYLDDDRLETAIKVHKYILGMIEDVHLREQEESEDDKDS